MLIFMRHGEDTDVSLSDVGFVRSNHLIDFFTYKKGPHLNTPKKIIVLKSKTDKSFQSVRKLAKELNVKIEDSYTNIIELLRLSLTTDILICGEYDVLISIIEKLIFKLYSKQLKLRWGRNPLNTFDDFNDYTSLWVIDNNTLSVYNLFDVTYNKQYSYFDITYKNVKKDPFESIKLTDDIYLVNRISNFIDDINIINRMWYSE